MSSAEFLAAVSARSDFASGQGLTEDEVRRVEREIGALPRGYRSLLRRFGWVSIAEFDIYGVEPGLPKHLDVVYMARDEREQGGLSPELVPMMNDGAGNLFCVTVAGSANSNEQVLLWVHETRSTYPVAPNVEAWIVDLAQAIDARD